MATPPSFTPPKDISGRLGALSVGKMLGVKGSASSVLANSKVRGVLGKKNFSYLKGKANLSSGRIPKHKMIEIIKDVQKTVKSPDRPAGLTNVDTQDKYSTATRVYGRHAREPRLRELANEKANRARSMQAKMEQAREERYKGVVDHRRPNKTGDNRRPDILAKPSVPGSKEEARAKALDRINKKMKEGGIEQEGAVKSSAWGEDRGRVSSLPEETGLPQKRTSQSSRVTETTRSTDIPLEQSDQKSQIGGKTGEKSGEPGESTIDTNLPF